MLALLLAAGSAIDLLRTGVEANAGWIPSLREPAVTTLPLSLLAAMLIGKQIRRQLSVRFDGFGIRFRRRLEARVLPWRTITRITAASHWHGTSIRIESQSATLTIAGGYYESAETLLEFLESQVRFHARIEARLATRHTNAPPPAAT